MAAIDTLFVLRAGAALLLALASGLVLHLVAKSDLQEEQPQSTARRTTPSPKAPDSLKRAA